MTSRGRPSAITRHVTPNGSVIAGPVVCPDGKPKTTGPGKSANRSAIDGARGRLAGRLVAARQLADDDGAGAREQAGLPQLRHHAIEPVRTLADFVEEQHVARRRIERERRAERRQQLRQRAAEQHAARLARARCVSRPAAPARPSARARHSARSNESRS